MRLYRTDKSYKQHLFLTELPVLQQIKGVMEVTNSNWKSFLSRRKHFYQLLGFLIGKICPLTDNNMSIIPVQAQNKLSSSDHCRKLGRNHILLNGSLSQIFHLLLQLHCSYFSFDQEKQLVFSSNMKG